MFFGPLFPFIAASRSKEQNYLNEKIQRSEKELKKLEDKFTRSTEIGLCG